jgi:hypothetical protein
MSSKKINGKESEFSEEDLQREHFGSVLGAPDPTKMPPQREKKKPKDVDPGHTTSSS